MLNQTLPVEMIVILPKKMQGSTIAEKLSKVLNDGLSHLKLESFDYILRVDSDTVLPASFLKENLKQQSDLSGDAGYAMIIKTSTFIQVMQGRFHPESDDSYTCYKFMQENRKVQKNRVKAILLRPSGVHHSIEYFVNRGTAMWKLGYEPLHVLMSWRWEWRNIFTVYGYLRAILRGTKRHDIAKFVWNKQVRRLLRLS